MGMIWDMIQQYQISNRRQETSTLEDKVANLEERVTVLEDFIEDVLTQLDHEMYEENNSPNYPDSPNTN